MRHVSISDFTLRSEASSPDYSLSFKEKIEIARELDKLGVDVVETAPISDDKADSLVVRTLAGVVNNSILSCPTGLSEESLDTAWNAVKEAKRPRLHVVVPVSSVQMEYICNKKPDAVLELIGTLVKRAAGYCGDVEFSAEDATRSEPEFLHSAIRRAIESGAKTITICDAAGTMLPGEFGGYISSIYEAVPEMKNVALSMQCSNEINMAVACVFAAIEAGAEQVKATVNGKGYPSLDALAQVFQARGHSLEVETGINMTAIQRSITRMTWLTNTERSSTSAFDNDMNGSGPSGDIVLDSSADIRAVGKALREIGYELSGEDLSKVYEAFGRIAVKKDVNARELEYIVASTALQVPPTYRIVSYVINSGNVINATANIVLERDGKQKRGLVTGDGPIDASFLAIEQITGQHYELDDFQIEAVTEGREAMGSTLVKLRSGGRLFSGHGISTDIIGASIRAYVDALNKIVYEENVR